MRPKATYRASAGLMCLVSLCIAFGSTGCSDRKDGGGKEADLISESSSKKVELPKGSGPLWSLPPGRTWKTLTVRNNQKNVGSEIRVVGPYRVPDGQTGTLVRSYRAGKPFRVEIYQSEKSGDMKLLALGESVEKLLVFSPAIPFLKGKTVEGEYFQWNGTARLGKQSYTASAFHRLSAVDPVTTPFETILTYRHDGIITLLNGTQRIDYPAVMWFVPGKGVAQRRLADRGTLALEVVTQFPK